MKPHTVPKSMIYGFFAVGILSAVAFRAIIIVQHVEPRWIRPVWYIGTAGYFLFFLYRYRIARKRKKAIADYRLMEKVRANACLDEEDREVVLYLLSSLSSSREDLNYAIIFVLSILAILADIALSTLG